MHIGYTTRKKADAKRAMQMSICQILEEEKVRRDEEIAQLRSKITHLEESVGLGVGAPTAGVKAQEYGMGYWKTTVLVLNDLSVALEATATAAVGSKKLYGFPQGYIYTQSAVSDLVVAKSSTGVIDTWEGDFALGTVAAAVDADLTSTEADIISKTAIPAATAGVTTANGVSTAAQHAILNGTSAAIDLYFNVLVDDGDHTVGTTPCDLILNGTVTINWLFVGDN